MPYNPRITPAFREECVAFALKNPSRPLAAIAKELQVSKSALTAWVKKHQTQAGLHAKRPLTDEQKRIAALEKEVRFLQEVNDILKKATTYFATENKRGMSL